MCLAIFFMGNLLRVSKHYPLPAWRKLRWAHSDLCAGAGAHRRSLGCAALRSHGKPGQAGTLVPWRVICVVRWRTLRRRAATHRWLGAVARVAART